MLIFMLELLTMFIFGLIQLTLTASIGFAALAGNNMDFLHPPYGTTTIQPRTLNRWLDINSQNGPLGRNRGYISIPFNLITPITGPALSISLTNNFGFGAVFFSIIDINNNIIETSPLLNNGDSYEFTTINNAHAIVSSTIPYLPQLLPSNGWTGSLTYNVNQSYSFTSSYTPSEKILQFNFSSTRNFSLVNDANFQSFKTAFEGVVVVTIVDILAVRNSFNIVKRYALTSFNREYINAIPYSGQKILGKYFQIEFWSLYNYQATLNPTTSPYILNTSALGNQDYRYGVDFSINNNISATVENFQNTNPNAINLFNLPLLFNILTINGTN